jgi:hypothetical protein
MTSPLRRGVAALFAGTLLMTITALPAAAAKSAAEPFHFSQRTSCAQGQLVTQVRGTTSLEIVGESADGQAFLADQQTDARESHNIRGLRYAVAYSSRYLETSMTLVAADDPRLADFEGIIGPVYEFEATQTFDIEVTRSDGTLITEFSESGSVQFVDLYDTLGDFTPGAEFLTGETIGELPTLLTTDPCEVAAVVAQV